MRNLRRLFVVSRPVSWVNTAYPFAAGYLLLGGGVDLLFILGTLFFLIPYNLVMYGVNDVFDYESDMRNPRKGSIEGAVEAKEFHPVIMWASLLAPAPFLAAFAWLMPWPAALTLAGVMFMVVAYSLGGLRFKERPVLDSITSSLHFVGPLLVAAALFSFPIEAWATIGAFFLWGMASHAFGAVQDVVPDRKARIASIATVFGARRTVRFSVLLYVASIVLVATQGWVGIAVAVAGTLYVINILPFWNVTDRKSSTTNRGWRRFIWINYLTGFVLTLGLIIQRLAM